MTNPVADGSCDNCPKGYYTSILGQTDCTICELGKYNNQIGFSGVVCANCPINTYGNAAGLTDVRKKEEEKEKEGTEEEPLWIDVAFGVVFVLLSVLLLVLLLIVLLINSSDQF